ncbi:hypothetical protein BWI15_06990 [Kribbella sp. ALI-6-A]|uniref:hypothetical protein n=1 Tax=Kribbella sp. ALI-6-A TaxID=1933817 RepID=UPI00097C7A29|nr:hypothetical protein [Kribbella sp. ALI-6-A]ONI75939.1 hypothetical protein BWI15_06990 [Kribbella sp. ALI-6-A]
MIPTWISVVGVVMTVLSPLLALGGVALGAYLTRKSDRELDTWRHREETMRMVRWAVEQILEDDDVGTDAGVVTLRSLMRSELLQPEDYELVAALTAAVAIDRVGEATYAELEDADTEVVTEAGPEEGSRRWLRRRP